MVPKLANSRLSPLNCWHKVLTLTEKYWHLWFCCYDLWPWYICSVGCQYTLLCKSRPPVWGSLGSGANRWKPDKIEFNASWKYTNKKTETLNYCLWTIKIVVRMLLLTSHTEVLKTDYGLLPQICFKILQIIDQGGPLMLPAFLCFLTISLFHFCSEMPFFLFQLQKMGCLWLYYSLKR